MNKELIKKYKKEFNHWLDNGDDSIHVIFYNTQYNEWDCLLDWNEIWEKDSMNFIPIINDQFVEFRKAMAEGKQIQFRNSTEWKDISFLTIRPEETPDMYRIKPEPTIKVGDWLFDLHYKTYHRVNHILSDKVELNGFNILLSAIDGTNYKLWEPNIAEWCIVDDPTASDRDYSFTVQKWGLTSKWTPIPYTGPIPYFIKD